MAPPSLILTSLKKVCKREKNKCARKKEEKLSWGFTLFWLSTILRNFCGVFLPYGFLEENICVLSVSMLVVLSVILLL